MAASKLGSPEKAHEQERNRDVERRASERRSRKRRREPWKLEGHDASRARRERVVSADRYVVAAAPRGRDSVLGVRTAAARSGRLARVGAGWRVVRARG